MTNSDKALLRLLIRKGKSFEDIKKYVNCSDKTIKNYMVALRKKVEGA
jgi:DNA-binding NarL/FixJ family response regulator